MKYPQLHTGQVWRVPDTGETITIDEVYASDVWNDNKWRAMVRYTVSSRDNSDLAIAEEFGAWMRDERFTLVEQQEAA